MAKFLAENPNLSTVGQIHSPCRFRKIGDTMGHHVPEFWAVSDSVNHAVAWSGAPKKAGLRFWQFEGLRRLPRSARNDQEMGLLFPWRSSRRALLWLQIYLNLASVSRGPGKPKSARKELHLD